MIDRTIWGRSRAGFGLLAVAGSAALSLVALERPAFAETSMLDCGAPERDGLTAQDPQVAPRLPDLSGLDEARRLDDVVALFRAAGIRRLYTIDRIVEAYCRDVSALPDLTHAQKVSKVRTFADRVTKVVYGERDESAIVVGLPLSPDIVADIDESARRRSQSREAWIRQAVLDALAAPNVAAKSPR